MAFLIAHCMRTHVEFISTDFPSYENEEEQINPGRFGKRLADFLAEGRRTSCLSN
jgi:hypothetical protein